MNEILNLLKTAGRRLNANAGLERLSFVGLIVAVIALAICLAERLLPVVDQSVQWIWAGPMLALLTLVTALALQLRRRPAPIHVAIEIDDRLALREKISTALACRGRDDGFAQAAIDDAIEIAHKPQTREQVRRKFPIVWPRRFWLTSSFVVAAFLSTLLPSTDILARGDVLTQQQRREVETVKEEFEAALVKIAEQLDTSPEDVRKLIEEKDGEDLEGAGEREKLKTPEEVRKDAFEKLQNLTENLREKTQDEKARALDELKDRLAQLDAGSEDDPANELAKSLKSGDFDDASKALQQLKQKLEQGDLDEEQKKALAEQLDKLAQQMEQLAQQNQALANALQDAGMDPNLANNQQALQQALQNAENLTPQQQQQLQQMANAMAQANNAMQGMQRAMQQMAQGMMQQGQMPDGAMQGMQGQLTQMEMMQQQMNAMQGALAEANSQCQGMGAGMGIGQSNGLNQADALAQWQQMMQQMSNNQGPGMGQRGQGRGGRAPRLAIQSKETPDNVDVKLNQGPIIGETFIDSNGLIRGVSMAEYQEQVRSQSVRAREELEENRISVLYEDAIKHFFGELEARAKVTTSTTESSDSTSSGDN